MLHFPSGPEPQQQEEKEPLQFYPRTRPGGDLGSHPFPCFCRAQGGKQLEVSSTISRAHLVGLTVDGAGFGEGVSRGLCSAL